MPAGKMPYLANVRSYLQNRVRGRATQTNPLQSFGSAPVHSFRRMNDTTPAGPPSGSTIIGGSSTTLYNNSTAIATGLTGNPLSLLPFRPNASPQPWMYVADASKAVTILASGFGCFGMLKVRSDGLTYKMGIKEPQNSPAVATQATTTSGTDIVLGSARPWTNVSGANPTFNYGDTGNGTGPSIILTPTVGAQLNLSASGTTVINGISRAPGDSGGVAGVNPGQFAPGSSCAILMGAWTDASGNVLTTAPNVISVGGGVSLIVPVGAARFQLGIDGVGGNFAGNTGQFLVNWTLVTSAITTVISTVGEVQAYVWGTAPPAGGGSPHTGPVASYIWKNPGDSGSGTPRSTTLPVPDTSPTNNSWQLDSSPEDGTVPVTWDTLDPTGATVGGIPLFDPMLETAGYQDFNVCLVGSIFVPAAGTYAFTFKNKDQILVGIGGNATVPGGYVTNVGPGYGQGQTMSVISALPLIYASVPNGTGTAVTQTLNVTFPGPGVYPLEVDWDYWDHTGRSMVMTVNGAAVPPIAGNAKNNVSYRYIYRGSLTGAKSNPSPASNPETVPNISNTITPEFSPDPQVDKVDFFRMDQGLDSFTYIGTGPNTNPPTSFTDQLLDADVANNPLLEFDNFEPFPSIDLPRRGIVNVIGGVVEWVSGDQFNIRWLPGTIINIGGLPYAFYNRPSNTTTLLAVDVQDGTNLIYEIAEPILAAQPMQSMWGETDNAAYAFAVGDPLRPGTLYFCKGNDLDSAPDTNQIEVDDPSATLVNGCMASGIGMVFSAENAWIIYPNFYTALATVTGVSGSAFTVVRSNVTRGLYIRPCICTDGSGTFFYRSKDGIERAPAGGPQKSMTDDDIYNLFTHEGFVPKIVTIAGFNIVPPDDTFPEQQRMAFVTGYLYYNYQGIDGNRYTLVLDVAGNGWVVDFYQHPVTVHSLPEGPNVNEVLVGCSDGSIRTLSGNGTEAATLCVVCTEAVNAGDARAKKSLGDIFVRASVITNSVAVAVYSNQYRTSLAGTYSPNILAANGNLSRYIVNSIAGQDYIVNDVEIAFSWIAGTDTYLDLWQPAFTSLPEDTQNRPTDWTDMGANGPSFVQGLTLEADTLGVSKVIGVQDDSGVTHIPDQSPVIFNGQSKQTLTFTPPFVAYQVRIVSTDMVPWRLFPTPAGAWVKLPFPPSVVEWQTQFSPLGGKGWQHLREVNVEYISSTALTLTIAFDPGAVWANMPTTMTITVPSSGGLQAKLKFPVPWNKFKLVSFRLSSQAPFRVFAEGFEAKIGLWGRDQAYRNVPPIGGDSSPGATV